MSTFETAFRAASIPDPQFLGYRNGSGAVKDRIDAGFEQLVRYIASLPTDSVKVALEFAFDPRPSSGHPHDRLDLRIRLMSDDASVFDGVRTMVMRGGVAEFYSLKECQQSVGLDEYSVGCQVLRHHIMEEPTTPRSMNSKIPEHYFCPHLFEAREDNDYLALDRIISGLDEKVLIHIAISPIDSSSLVGRFNGYLRDLQEMGRSWSGYDDAPKIQDLLPDASWSRDQVVRLKPHRQPDETALWVSRGIQKFRDELHEMRLKFQLMILSEQAPTARLVGRSFAESCFEDGRFVLEELTSMDMWKRQIASNRIPIVDRPSVYPDIKELSQVLGIASPEELNGAFRFPVAGQGAPLCMRRNTDQHVMNSDNTILLGWDHESDSGSGKVPVGLPLQSLSRHLFISGSTGSGKSTVLVQLMLQLQAADVPFILFEPVKTEFRCIKQSRNHDQAHIRKLASQLQVFSPGNENVSPLRWNPMSVMAGITPLEHQDELRMTLRAAVPMSGSLPALIEEGLEDVYVGGDQVPKFQDLVDSVKDALRRKQYSPGTQSDFMGAIDARLGSMTRGAIGRVFDSRELIPGLEQLMTRPSVIEMDRLSSESRCLLTLFLLVSIREYIRTHPTKDGTLRFVIIIDEAHNIVGTDSKGQASEDNPDAGAHASEYLCRMLAEMRSQGVGVVVCDQVPSAVAPEVMKHTVTKLAFQQTHEEDRAAIGASMLFSGVEYEDIGRLCPGEAYLFSGGYYRSRKIRTVNVHEQMDMRFLADQALRKLLLDEPWFEEHQVRRIGNDLAQYDAWLKHFEEKRSGLIQQVVQWVAQVAQLRSGSGSVRHLANNGKSLVEEYNRLTREFGKILCQLEVRHALAPHAIPSTKPSHSLQSWAQSQIQQVDQARCDIHQCQEILRSKVVELRKMPIRKEIS